MRGAGGRGGTDMPQLGSGGGDDLGATDEMLAFKDEGEQEEKIPENAFTERDLADLKSSLVNESEGSGSPAAAADPEVSRAAPHGPLRPARAPPSRHPPLCPSLSSHPGHPPRAGSAEGLSGEAPGPHGRWLVAAIFVAVPLSFAVPDSPPRHRPSPAPVPAGKSWGSPRDPHTLTVRSFGITEPKASQIRRHFFRPPRQAEQPSVVRRIVMGNSDFSRYEAPGPRDV